MCGSFWRHKPVSLPLLACVILLVGVAVASSSTSSGARAAAPRHKAICALKIVGSGKKLSIVQYNTPGSEQLDGFRVEERPQLAVPPAAAAAGGGGQGHHLTSAKLLSVALHCHSEQGPIPVFVNGNLITNQHVVQQFTGVKAHYNEQSGSDGQRDNRNGNSITQIITDGTDCGPHRQASKALLHFCGDFHLEFTHLTIQGVQLTADIEPSTEPIPLHISSPVVLFGSASRHNSLTVSIQQTYIVNTASHAALFIGGSSRVNISNMICRGSLGQSGACLAVADAAVVQLSSSMVDNCTAVRGAGLFVSDDASVGITNSTFANCAGVVAGGAILVRNQADLKIHNSTLHYNRVANQDVTRGAGGALAVADHARARIYISQLQHNTAALAGGAVYVSDQANLAVNSSTFQSNHAVNHNMTAGWGGALSATSNGTLVRVEGVAFYNNTAALAGGAVDVDDQAYLNVTNSTFQSNRVVNRDLAEGWGGALSATSKGTLVRVENVTFYNNTAALAGGAVYVGLRANLAVNSSTFQSNRAVNHHMTEGWGGALSATSNGTLVRVEGVAFYNNTAALAGGAVDVDDQAYLNVTNSTFQSNRVVNRDLAEGWGGALSATSKGTLVRVENVTFYNNTAALAGGAVYVGHQAYLNVTNSTFKFNQAGNREIDFGRAMSAAGNDAIATTIIESENVPDSSFGMGGALSAAGNGTIVRVMAVTFYSNTASFAGGAVYINDQATLQLNHSTFAAHMSASIGGALAASDSGTRVRITAVTFYNNIAGYEGGAVYVDDQAYLIVTNSTFKSNCAVSTTVGWGGALSAAGNGTLVRVEDVVFYNNTARSNGGAVSVVDRATLDLNNSTFEYNHAVTQDMTEGLGGGLCLMGNSVAKMLRAAFLRNTAVYAGGAIYAAYTSAFEMRNSTLLSNRVVNRDMTMGGGGALAVYDNVTVNVIDSSFEGNSATAIGGAILVNGLAGSNLALKNALSGGSQGFKQRPTPWWLLWFFEFPDEIRASVVIMHHCTISSNQAGQEGGGFRVVSSNLTVLNSTMTGNNCEGRGGIGGLLSMEGNSSHPVHVYFKGNSISNSSADVGGAVMAVVRERNVSVSNLPCRHAAVNELRDTVSIISSSKHQADTGAYCSTLDVLDTAVISKSTAFVGQGMVLDGRLLRVNLTGSSFMLNGSDVLRKSGLCVMGDKAPTADGFCEMCPEHMYSLDPESRPRSCTPCPSHATCVGGAVVLANDSFYNTNNESNNCTPSNIIRCPNPQACSHTVDDNLVQVHPYFYTFITTSSDPSINHNLSWQNYTDLLCKVGYRGLLCGSCKPQFGQTDPFTCSPCFGVDEDGTGSIQQEGIYVLMALYVVLLVLVVWGTAATIPLSLTQQRAADCHADSETAASEGDTISGDGDEGNQLLPTDVVKALIMYAQYFAGIIAKLPVRWPDAVSKHMRALNDVWGKAFGSVASLDCLLQAINYFNPQVDRSSLKALINLLLPVLVLLLVLNCQMIWWACQRMIKAALATLILRLLNCVFGASDGVVHLTATSDHAEQRSQKMCGAAVTRFISRIKRWCIQSQFQASRPQRWSHVSSLGHYMQQRWVITLLATMFFFYPSVARIAVSMLTCIKVCDGLYWVMDMDLLCPIEHWKQSPGSWPVYARWAAGVGIPALVFLVAVPAFVISLLLWAAVKKHLHKPEFQNRFGFMYGDYKTDLIGWQQPSETISNGTSPRAANSRLPSLRKRVVQHLTLVWDAVIHIQTVVLVCVSVIGMVLHEYYQTLILAAVFGMYLIFIAWLRPFRNPSVQRLQDMSSATLTVTCSLILFSIPPDYMDERQHAFYKAVQPVSGALLVVANMAFVSWALMELLRCLARTMLGWRHLTHPCRQLRTMSLPTRGSQNNVSQD